LHVAAATKKAATKGSSKKGEDAKATTGVTAGVKALAVNDVPLPQSRNLNVVEEYEKSKGKKHASFVVVGKSAARNSLLPKTFI
jgi:elongation factor 1 alpha-like protein